MRRPWNFLKNVFWQKKVDGDVILNFRWCHQNLVSGLHNSHQSRDIANDITNRHIFIREIAITSFNWDTRGMTYAVLYRHTILEKSVRWKLWYCFESLALWYSPENHPHLLTLSTFLTWRHRYFCFCIRRATKSSKWVSNICKNVCLRFF